MELIVSRIIGLLVVVIAAAMVAATIGYVAHYDFGLSRLDIRSSALTGAAFLTWVVVRLLAEQFFDSWENPNTPAFIPASAQQLYLHVNDLLTNQEDGRSDTIQEAQNA
jgi:hypothetical protein